MVSAFRLTCRSIYLFRNVINLHGRQSLLLQKYRPLIYTCTFATQKDIEDSLQQLKEGKHKSMRDPDSGLPHFKTSLPKSESDEIKEDKSYTLPHPIWNKEELENVVVTHKPPKGFVDHFAYYCVQTVRLGFDIISGYKFGKLTEGKWLHRIIYLETIAGVPGMVAAMVRHLNSLRRMKRDHGWIHTLLEEAENERMHLMTALQIKKPSWFFRTAVIVTQGIFVNMFSICYLISPRFCHRMVGYLEEEAVKTYTKLLHDIDSDRLPQWKNMPAPEIAVQYWHLPMNATFRDVVLAIRADEAHHRLVNHTLGSMHLDETNPFKPGQ